MQNGIFKLDWASVGEAVLTAVVFAILAAFVTLVGGGDFNIFTANWPLIGENMTNIGFAAGIVSLAKDILSTNNGSFLGITPPTT
jgi:hypothetical protein